MDLEVWMAGGEGVRTSAFLHLLPHVRLSARAVALLRSDRHPRRRLTRQLAVVSEAPLHATLNIGRNAALRYGVDTGEGDIPAKQQCVRAVSRVPREAPGRNGAHHGGGQRGARGEDEDREAPAQGYETARAVGLGGERVGGRTLELVGVVTRYGYVLSVLV